MRVSAGLDHSVILQPDGTARAFGLNDYGQCNIPPLEEGRRYVQVSAGWYHSVLLRDDGTLASCGDNEWGACVMPTESPFFAGSYYANAYAQISAGTRCSLLLRGDGHCEVMALSTGDWDDHVHCVPRLPDGVMLAQVAAGRVAYEHDFTGRGQDCHLFLDSRGEVWERTPRGGYQRLSSHSGFDQIDTAIGDEAWLEVLLRTDGTVLARGENDHGQADIPKLDDGVTYVQVSTSGLHTVLLRSDGLAVACGDNFYGQCEIPPLEEGIIFLEVSAGNSHTLFIRSDGSVMSTGCRENQVPPGTRAFVPERPHPCIRALPDYVVQVSMSSALEVIGTKRMVGYDVVLQGLGGEILHEWHWNDDLLQSALLQGITPWVLQACHEVLKNHLIHVRQPRARRMCVVLPGGHLFTRDLEWWTFLERSDLPAAFS